MQGMDIRTMDVGNASDFANWFAVYEAARIHDMPDGPRWLEREKRARFVSDDFYEIAVWLAEDSGAAVGAAVLELPLKENPRLAEFEIAVQPRMRRRGIGTALLNALADQAVQRGRLSLLTYISGSLAATSTPGTVFAERHGFTARLTDVMRVQRRPFQLDRLAELERAAVAHAESYQLMVMRDRILDEHVVEYARLAGRMSTDSPLGELDYEAENWDAERVRVAEDRRERMGRSSWHAVAIAPDGTLAGMTEIGLAVDDHCVAYQGDTIVDPHHRGHRLGLLLKMANLRALLADRPGVEAIWTENAASNSFMISVNEKFGYVRAGWNAMYQRG